MPVDADVDVDVVSIHSTYSNAIQSDDFSGSGTDGTGRLSSDLEEYLCMY